MTEALVTTNLLRLVNLEAEQALLGAMFISNRAYERVADHLTAADFGNPVHGRIYEAIGKVIDRGHTASPVTLKSLFDQDSALSEIGGITYLARLAASAVTTINAPAYADAISDLAHRRRLIEACNDTIADAGTIDADRPCASVIEEHEQRVFDLAERRDERGPVHLAVAVAAVIKAAEEAHKRGGALAGITSGLLDLDHLLGGLMPGNLEIIAGRPGMGKTSFAIGVALAAARSGCPVAIFSLEETREQLSQRLIAILAGIGTDRQRRGDLEKVDWTNLLEAQRELDRLPITIDDTSGLTVLQITQRSRRLKRQRGIGMVIVDHIGLVRVPGRVESRRTEVGAITRALKASAKDLAIPVVALSQLSRAPESRDNKRPMLSDLRETGDIEQDADRVMFVFRQEYYLTRDEPMRRSDEDDGKFNDRVERWQRDLARCAGVGEIIVAKNRHGPVSIISVKWDASRTLFSNLARR